MKRVVVGSVLAEGRCGAWRVVRKVTRFQDGDLAYVTFAIRRCSWTRRCYTVVNYVDLKQRGFRMVQVKPRRLTGALDRKIAKAIRGREMPGHYTLTCCDVEGVA